MKMRITKRNPGLLGWGQFLAVLMGGFVLTARSGDVTADKVTVNDALLVGGSNSIWNVTNSVMAQWHLDDNTNDTTVTDSSGKSHTGTLGGGENTQDKHVAGRVGTGALTFNGSDDYVSVPNSSDFQFGTNSFSIAVWVKPDSISEACLVDKTVWATDYPQFRLQLCSSGKISWGTHYIDYSDMYSVATLSTGVWTHVAVVRFNDGRMQIYINGALDNEVTKTVRYVTNNNILTLARESRGTWGPYSGKLDDVVILDKGLSAAEARGLYHEGLGTPALTGVQYGIVRGELVFEGNTNRIKGKLRADQGVSYSPALGDLLMGSFTNQP